MQIDIGIQDYNKANLFLRCLWSEFDSKYGKCAWMFQPYKDSKKNRIYLGMMDINLEEVIAVYVYYKQRGSIKKLEFLSSDEEELSDDLQQKIRYVVIKVLSSYMELKQIEGKYDVVSFYPFGKYESELFTLNSVDENRSRITCKINCYGHKDGRYLGEIIITRILDVLSVLTNLPYYRRSLVENSINDTYEVFYDNVNYIDGYSCYNEKVLLSEGGKKFIEQIVAYNKMIEEDNIIKILKAARHFHTGRKFDAQIMDLIMMSDISQGKISIKHRDMTAARDVCDNMFEMAVVSYISALEVLASIMYPDDGVRCECCGQVSYSISSKVKRLLMRYFEEPLAKNIHSIYSGRSKFLHTGHMLTNTYIGTTIPQLDKNSPSGVEMIVEVSLLNLREYVGYCARCVIREKFLEDTSVIIYQKES